MWLLLAARLAAVLADKDEVAGDERAPARIIVRKRGNAPEWFHKLQKLPSEYFRDNWYATFWFETGRGDLQHLIDTVGEDNVMFETDFLHPTSLHPNPLEKVSAQIGSLREETQRKVMCGNAVKLYRL